MGQTVRFAEQDWTIVGHFSAGGSSFESEIWGENEQFMPVFRGQVFQSITFRMKDPAAFDGVKESLEADARLVVDAERELTFYENQSSGVATMLSFIAVFIASIMAVGAVFGAVNTMYAAVASRAPEIGVLLTLGFQPRSVMSSFLLESVFIALVGGDRLPPCPADQRARDQHHELGFVQRDCLCVSGDAGAAAQRNALRAGNGLLRRAPAGTPRGEAAGRRRASGGVGSLLRTMARSAETEPLKIGGGDDATSTVPDQRRAGRLRDLLLGPAGEEFDVARASSRPVGPPR